MCYTCYEIAGKPNITNKKVLRAASLGKEVGNHIGCTNGGYANVVLDDYNLDDKDIDYAIDLSRHHDDPYIVDSGREACLKFLYFMKKLSVDERYSVLARMHGFIS